AHDQTLRTGDAERGFHPLRRGLQAVVEGPQLLHELQHGAEVIVRDRVCLFRHRHKRRAKRSRVATQRMSGASSLNSGVPATPSRSNRTVSVLVIVAPAFSHRRKPTCRLSSVRDTIASCGRKTANPPRNRSRTVWKTQTCASMPATITCLRPVCRISRATGFDAPQENSSFSIGDDASSSRSSGIVSPSPFLYCSLATIGSPRRRATLRRTPAFLVRRAMPSGGIARAS